MSGTTSKPTKAVTLARVQALLSGLQKHFPNQSFKLGNQSFTTATLAAALQSLVDAINVANGAHAAVKDALLALEGTRTKVAPIIRDLRRFVFAAFGDATQELSDFGLQPPKAKQPLTTEQRAAAEAKAKATRKARGTDKGKKERKSVKGDVTGVQIIPVTEAPASPNPQAPKQ